MKSHEIMIMFIQESKFNKLLFLHLTRLKINSVLDREWNIFFFQNLFKTFKDFSKRFQDFLHFKDFQDISRLSFLFLWIHINSDHYIILKSSIHFQVMHPDSQPGRQYIIDVEVQNNGIPYADSFYVTVHFYLSR